MRNKPRISKNSDRAEIRIYDLEIKSLRVTHTDHSAKEA